MNITRTTVRMWTAAVDLATTIRTDLTTATTGRRWRRAPVDCPAWCGRGHLCTAQHGYPSGQHRSTPAVFGTGYGSLVASRVATVDGTHRVELRRHRHPAPRRAHRRPARPGRAHRNPPARRRPHHPRPPDLGRRPRRRLPGGVA